LPNLLKFDKVALLETRNSGGTGGLKWQCSADCHFF